MATPAEAAAVTRDEIHAERARWRPTEKGRPATRERPSARARLERAAARERVLPLVRGGGPEAARAWALEDYGHPSVAHRVSGVPLEVRIWPRRPALCPEAIYHPSGVWYAVRLLG